MTTTAGAASVPEAAARPRAGASEQRRPDPQTVEAIACRDCGQAHHLPPMPDRTVASCTRCGSTLYQRIHRSVDRSLACYLGALILFYVANDYPIMSMELEGRAQATTIVAGAAGIWREGMPFLSMVVLLAGTVVPLARIVAGVYVLLPLRLGGSPPALGRVFRWTRRLRPWAMMEVYLLGLIVAYVKLGDLATVGLGPAAWAFAALILVLLAADVNLDPHAVWSRIQPQAGPPALRPRPGAALVSCHDCDQLVHLPAAGASGGHDFCPRCRARLHRRKPESLLRAWVLLGTAAALYVPANILPVMTVVYFGSGDPSTIVGGIRTLIDEGMVPVALLVLFASVTVPVLKIAGLAGLLLSTQRRWRRRVRERTVLYRVIEGIGRWSMVDIFMIAILTALVRMGTISSVEPERGAVAFAAVVILTMLAAEAFDPRLMWDAIDERDDDEAAAAA